MSERAVITIQESKRLTELEEVIERGIATFKEVGEALAEIRDSKLYRVEYKTFEDYCREEWQMARRTAYQFIDGSAVAENVRNCAQVEPKNESQARPLTKLETPEQQREAWTAAVESSGGKPTAKHVEAAVEEIKQREEPQPERVTAAIHPCDGLQYAAMAIENLRKIHPRDTQREAAFEKVMNYINRTRK